MPDMPEAESVQDPRRGRPPKLTAEQVERLREQVLSQPSCSMADLARLFEKQEGVRLSRGTLGKYLEKAGLERIKRPRSSPKAVVVSAETPTPDPTRYRDAHRDEGDALRYPHGLTDAEWEQVRDLFDPPGPGRPPKHSRRQMVDAICYVLRSGCPWRMLPKDFPPWQAVYAQFRRWSDIELFERMHDRIRAMWREREHRAVEPTGVIIDAQSVRTSAQGGPKGFDAGKKVKGRKRHLVTDTLGLVLAVLITTGDIQDRDAAEPAIAIAVSKYPTIEKGWADGGYSGKTLDMIRRTHGLDIEVVRHPGNRNVGIWHDKQLPLPNFEQLSGFVVLPRRWVVERTNAWTDRCRRMNKDHDRLTVVATNWIWFAHARMLLHRLVHVDTSSDLQKVAT